MWEPLNRTGMPVIISGPCSAETEEQVIETARNLAKIPEVRIFRAGIWKPRTRPNTFEGAGNAGLKWLRRVKPETGLLTAVEVARPEHIEEVLKNNIDMVWIGARTVVNPFSVQELAGALRGIDIPVLIKNPVNPDIELWVGALERISQAGITRIAAIHRGFYQYIKSIYRNLPMWEIPIELKRRYPQLPVICDPSHICGSRSLIYPVAQEALDLEMDGLMIEAHYQPEQALTDKNQQITPADLKELLSRLVIRSKSGNEDLEFRLNVLRNEIDKTDSDLIDILCRRMGIVNQIGEYKRDYKVTILQLQRWTDVLQDRIRKGEMSGLDKEFLLRIFKVIHDESIRRQNEILNRL